MTFVTCSGTNNAETVSEFLFYGKVKQMKTLYLIGGTMGVGKTAVSACLKEKLEHSVMLDGDWCWDMHPFVVNEETKRMVMINITALLRSFLDCSVLEHIVFCWVMHEQGIIDDILGRLNVQDCRVVAVSLTAGEQTLRERLLRDVKRGVRCEDVIDRSVARIPLYEKLQTQRIATDGKTPAAIAD